jgi:transglutaminase-like putative cysteine protease
MGPGPGGGKCDMDDALKIYVTPTAIIDSDHPAVAAHAAAAIRETENDPVVKAVRLYYVVRDGIWYDPYLPFYKPEHYRASRVLDAGRAFCIGKAALLCALGRASGIPSRVGFADVRNHLTTRQLREFMGTDVFVFHGYTEFLLEGRWVKATPAFNIELCRRHRVKPLDFDGHADGLFQPYNEESRRFMEYVRDHGAFTDVPVPRIVSAWEEAYGKDRVSRWVRSFEASGGRSIQHFEREDVVDI